MPFSKGDTQIYSGICVLENMIVVVFVLKIAVARHEVYKEMELVLKKVRWGSWALFEVQALQYDIKC